jgi:hypothetical protein
LAVLLNNGSGQFSAPIRSAVLDASDQTGNAVPNYFYDFTLGDFRNTGLSDFVAIGSPYSPGSSQIAFAKSNGDGTFTPLPVARPSGAQGMIGVGDFNGDGKLDIAVVGFVNSASSSDYTLNVFLGNGDGTFRPGYSVTAASGGLIPYEVWIGDFNGDGKADILVEMQTNGFSAANVYEFLGNGDGTFATGKIVLQNFGPMNVADLNHDGIADIVEMLGSGGDLAQAVPLQYAIYLGQRDGSFALQNTYQLNAGTLAYQYLYSPGVMLGDFNGDGNIDIAAFQAVSGPSDIGEGVDTILQILVGNGDGTFTPTYTTFDFNQFVVPNVTADLNGDGKSDLLELDGYGSAFQIVPADAGPALQVNLLTYPIFGSTGSVRVTLAVPSASDTTIQLAASDPAISLPTSISIPANSASQDVQFQMGSGFNPNHVFSIQASLGTQTATAYAWKANNSQGTFVVSPTTLYSWPILAGETTGEYDFTISSLFDYSTDVQFSCTGLPAWASCQFPPGPLYLPPGGSRTSGWVVTTTSAAVIGSYPFTMIATDGTVTEQVSSKLNIGDFGISITPSTANAPTTGSASYSLTISSINGYSGAVQTSISGLPAGATVTSGLGSLTAGTSSSSLNIQTTNVATGSYPFTVTGTADSFTRSASATLVVQALPPAFTGSITPTSATLSVGQSANFAITLNSQNGATGTVNLQCLNVPTGTTCAFSPTAPTLPANGSAPDTLTVQVNSMPAASPPRTPAPWSYPTGRFRTLWVFVITLAVGSVLTMKMSRRRRRQVAGAAVLLGIGVLFVATASCGGGGGGGSGSSPPPPSSVTFTLTVQASGAGVTTTQTLGTLTITVN